MSLKEHVIEMFLRFLIFWLVVPSHCNLQSVFWCFDTLKNYGSQHSGGNRSPNNSYLDFKIFKGGVKLFRNAHIFCARKNPVNWRHWLSWRARIVAPIQKIPYMGDTDSLGVCANTNTMKSHLFDTFLHFWALFSHKFAFFCTFCDFSCTFCKKKSCVTCHKCHVTCRMSHVTCHMSPSTCH